MTASRRAIITGLAALPLASVPVLAVTAGKSGNDALLTATVADMIEVEKAQLALMKRPEYRDLDCHQIPGLIAMEDRLKGLFAIIIATRADSAHGLRAKALAMRTGYVQGDLYAIDDAGVSLADDIVRLFPNEAAYV